MARLVLLLALLLLLLLGCTPGEPQLWVLAESVAQRPDSWEVAVGVRRVESIEPRGIRRFPDGGRPEILHQEFRIFILNARASEVLRRVIVPAPVELRTAFRGHLQGWRGDTLFVALSGCPERECDGERIHRQFLALTAHGELIPIDEEPTGLDTVPGSLAPLPGESPYVRYSTDGIIVSVRTEQEFVPRFRVDADGDLTALPFTETPR